MSNKIRFRPSRLLICIVVINIILFYCIWNSFILKPIFTTSSLSSSASVFLGKNENNLFSNELLKKGAKIKTSKHIRKSITIVFRNVDNFDNDLKNSIDSILKIIPNMPIIIMQDNIQYPPLKYESNLTTIESSSNYKVPNSVQVFTLNFDIFKKSRLSALLAIKTKYVLFVPDSFRLTSKSLLQKILKDIQNISNEPKINIVGNNVKKKHKELNKNFDLKDAFRSNETIYNMNSTNNSFKSDSSDEKNKVKRIYNNGKSKKNKNLKTDMKDDLLTQNKKFYETFCNTKIVIVPFAGNSKNFSSCTNIIFSFSNWTIEYNVVNTTANNCDLYLQKHAMLLDVALLKEMPDGLAAPFPEMFYVQAKILNIKKRIFPIAFQDGRRLFASYNNKQRRSEVRENQFREMYRKLQIKKIVKHFYKIKTVGKDPVFYNNQSHNLILDDQFSSSNYSLPLQTEIDLIGCERTTKSCIFPVYNRTPFYVYLKKHTPPCCFEKLISVFYKVLKEFENVGIRYWLDNFALKSAIEIGNISPDAYEIDISFISFDLNRSNSLKKSELKPFSDSDGFYWIKATDGQYFKVQFSKFNQIGINLLPFEISLNLVKPTEFFGWKAKMFSTEFLHPMSTVNFLGKNVMCPNNVREYLNQKGVV